LFSFGVPLSFLGLQVWSSGGHDESESSVRDLPPTGRKKEEEEKSDSIYSDLFVIL
jgi:hypothetical protein